MNRDGFNVAELMNSFTYDEPKLIVTNGKLDVDRHEVLDIISAGDHYTEPKDVDVWYFIYSKVPTVGVYYHDEDNVASYESYYISQDGEFMTLYCFDAVAESGDKDVCVNVSFMHNDGVPMDNVTFYVTKE
ncbi:MAG: hypothetical protein IK115_13840 [Lachnospiraceae bacterium]|nr:hypothetical protein [Lachnospiraceae bacterium]